MPYIAPFTGEYPAENTPTLGRVADYGQYDSQIARGIRSAFTGAKSSLQGFAGMGAELLGADDYARQLYSDAQANQQLAAEQGPRVRTIRQVMESENPLSAGVDYLAGVAGQTTPYLLLGGAGALAGRGLGLVSGLRAGLSGEALAARAATGAGWGGTASIHPVMAGDQAVQLQEDPAAAGMGVGERALRANVVGGLQAAANALAPAVMVNQTFSRGARQALLPRVVGNMALEGAGEAGEDVVGQLHRADYDPNYRFDPEQTGENFAAGFFGAAPVAGIHGVATNAAHGAADVAVDGTKALGAGAQWVGEQAYQNMPPQVQRVADALAGGAQATKETLDVIAPYVKDAASAAGDVVRNFYNDTKENIQQYREDALADASPSMEDVLTDLTENVFTAGEQAKAESKRIAEDIRNDPAISDGVKAFLSGATTKADRLAKTAEAFSDLSKWVDENETLTVEKLKAIDSAAQQPQRLRRYAEEIIDFIDETGQDTPAAGELRAYAGRMARGENLSAEDVRNFWLKSRLAAEVERTSENLDKLFSAKGVKMTVEGGKVDTQNLSRQGDIINKAVREALANATTDKELIKAVARRIQTRDVMEKGADRAVREAVTSALTARGIDPKANQTFTDMFDRVLSAVSGQVAELKEEGVIPAFTLEDAPEAFRADVRDAFVDLLQNTEAGREMASSEALVNKHADQLTEYITRLASGELGEGAAVKLRNVLERTFGKEKEGVVDRTIDRLIAAASSAFGGLGNESAERVHGLVNLSQTLAQKEARIRQLIKFDVGEGRKLRGEIDTLLDEIERAREFDAKRAELPAALREAKKRLSALPQNSDEAYRLRGMLHQLSRSGLINAKGVIEEGTTGFNSLKRKWVSEGIVSARNFDSLVEALESYSGNPERLVRPEKREANHATSANHAAEDENDIEGRQDAADVADEEDRPISNFDLDGKRTGDERQEYLEKRRRDNYGQDVTESKAAKPIYWGANAFEAGAHDAEKVSAPVSRHESADYRRASGAPGTEYNAMVGEAYAKYGHRVTDGHPVSVQRWAAEMADATGKSERKLMNEAMQALLEHDQKRLKNPKLSLEDKQWIEARADLAGRLGDRGNAGERFFADKMNKNYSYYKMKPSDGTNLSYSRDYLERTAALRTDGANTDDPGVYIQRMQERDRHVFDDKVYKNSLLELTTSDDKTITVDIAKLVREAIERRQAAETKGLGEKNIEPDIGNDILTTFYNVMAALMTTDGIAEVGGVFEADDPTGGDWKGKRRPTGDFTKHIDPNIVIFRDPTGKMIQTGEHVLSHSVKRAFTAGDLGKITGVDPKTLQSTRKGRGIIGEDDLGAILRAGRRRNSEKSVASGLERGVAVGGAMQGDRAVNVDYHQLLSRALERNGIDPHRALQMENLPEKLAAMLLREGLADLRAHGLEGDAVNPASTVYDKLVVYHKTYGDESYPVTWKRLRQLGDKVDAPRSLRDAKIQELNDLLDEADAMEASFAKRQADPNGGLEFSEKGSLHAKMRAAYVDHAYDRANFDYGTPEGQDSSGRKMRASVDGGRVVGEKNKLEGLGIKHTVDDNDTLRFSQDEGENMRIQQILKELGEDASGDTPLFDKTEAFGTTGGKQMVRTDVKEAGPDVQMEAAKKRVENTTNYVASLRERLVEIAAKDPMAKKFLEETFDMPFLEGDKVSKQFGEFMEDRAAKLNKMARTRNDLGSVQRELPEKSKPLSLAEQRANAKMTVETLATNEQGKKQAANDIRAEEIAKAKAAIGAEQEAERKAAAKKRLDEQEKQAMVAVQPKPVETLPEVKPAVDVATTTGSRLEATRYLNGLDPETLKQTLASLPENPEAGTYASHIRKELTKPSAVMKDWADGILKKAGMSARDLEPAPFSRQRTVKEPRAGAASQEQLQAEVDRLLGEGKVTLEMPFEVKDNDGKGVSGKYDQQLKKILVSAVAADRKGTTWHETWHRVEDLLGDMGEHGKRVLDEMHKYVSTPMMQNWLQRTYNGDEGVLGQLDTPSERAAFAFQMFMHGAKMPIADKTTFQRVRDWVRKALEKLGFGTTTNSERGENFFQYVKDGGFARDVENAASVRKGLGEKKGDSLMKAAADTLKPVVEGVEKVLQHSSTRVRNLNIPEYTEILETLTGKTGKGGVQLDTHRHRNKFANIVGDILGGKTPEEQYQIFAGDGLNGVLAQISKYMADAGVDQRTRMNMLHRVEAFNQDLINDNFEGFVTDLVQHGGFKGKAGEARKIASQIVDNGYFYDPDIKLFEKRADLADKWMERGTIDKMLRYIDRAVHTAEYTRRFGQVKEYTSPTGLKYKQAEKLHDLLEKGDEKATPEGRKLIRDFIDAQNGQYGGRLSPEMKKLYGGLLFAQNVHILPTAVFSQMLEPMQLALRRNSMRGSLDSLFRGIRDLPKTFDAVNKKVMPDRWEKMMNDVGAAPSRIIRSTMADLMNGVHLHGAVGEANNNFFKYTFQEQWNRSMHAEGVYHAVEFMREHKENIEKNMGETDKDGRLRSERLLDELELKASDIKFNAAGELVLNDKTERAIVQFVEEALAHPDPGSNPMWMNDPRWALIAQMKRFTFAQTRFILDRGINELKLGNAFPLAPALIAMPWMMAADGLRDVLRGSEGYQAKGALDYATHAMERASLFGRAQLGLDALNAAGRGGSPVEAVAGPTAEMFGNIARGAHNGHLIDTMLGYIPGGGVVQAVM